MIEMRRNVGDNAHKLEGRIQSIITATNTAFDRFNNLQAAAEREQIEKIEQFEQC